jgi:hypothetical protein
LTSANQNTEGYFGGAVTGIPDLNGDGKGDVAVGAPGEDVNSISGAGRVYVYSGALGNRIRTLVSPTPTIGGAFGASVTGIPDVDGDGLGDIAVGAPDEHGGGVLASGKVYIFSGSTGTLLRTLISPGRRSGGNFGASIAGMRDCTGDGRGDLVIGAFGEMVAGLPAGRAYIYSGRNGGLWRTLLPPIPQSNGQFGFSVGAVPDVNGDGRGDCIVGAPREHPNGTPINSGRAHIFSGANGGRLLTLSSPGIAADGFFGDSVAGLDDCTGDGRGDVVVGAPLEHPSTSPLNCGRAYIFNGTSGALWKKLLPNAPVVNGQFGISVAGVPDTNLDGRGDVLVGAWQEGTPSFSGRAHLFSGSGGTGFVPIRLMVLASPNLTTNGRYGVSVAGLPSAGGSTRGDFVIGASTEEAAGAPADAGRAYIYRR